MAEREPWEDELVEGLVKAGQDNFSAADSEEAMENIADPIAKAIKQGGSSGQQQSDWNETDPSKVTFIKNKPNLPSDIPSRQEMAAAIGAETSRATAAEASLQTQINGKASQSALEAETAARESADTQLQSNIDAETARAEAEESALGTRLTTAESDIDTLESGLSAETEARESADSTLQTNIDNEATARENADNALDARLDEAESDIDSLESSVDALYNTEVEQTDGETSVSSSTSGKVKTFVVGLASAIKTKIEAAYSHISDAVKHITATERTNWNTAYTHSQTEGNPHGTTIEEIDGLRTELTTIESDVSAIEGVIPSEATTSNKLADKSFVNSSIASQTAYFRGTFDIVDDLGLAHGASNTAIANALASVVSVVTPNDHTFVIDQDTDGNVLYKRFKYSNSVWQYEYTLNNSSFTASQWAAIQSGITADDVADIGYNTTARHSHSNKNLLDTYTQSNASLVDAVAKKHEHANKTILDNTTASYTTEDKAALDGKLDKTGLEYTSGENLVYQQFTKGSVNTSVTDGGLSITINPENRDTYFLIKFADNINLGEVISVSFDVEYEGDDDGNWNWRLRFPSQSAGQPLISVNGKGHYSGSGVVHVARSKDSTTICCDDADRPILPTNSFKIKNLKFERGSVATGFCLCPAEQRAATLTTPRSIQTDLGSTSAPTFDGSANITPGVTGTLLIEHGGTGATTAKAAEYNILTNMETDLGNFGFDEIRLAIAGGVSVQTPTTGRLAGYRTVGRLWNYINTKISSVLGLTETNYAGTAAKATADASGNNIASTYATKSEIPDVSGKEDASNKVTTLDDSTTHYPSTSAVTTALAEKQDTISDIATIRSNAENGQTAYGWGNHANAGYLTDADLSGYAKTDGSNASGDWSNITAGKALGVLGAVGSNVSHIFTTPTEWGASAGDTPASIWNSMPKYSMLYCSASTLTNSEWSFPYSSGIAILVKYTSVARGFIFCIQKEGGGVAKLKLQGSDGNTPTLPWEVLANSAGQVGSTTQPVYVNASGQVTACGIGMYVRDGGTHNLTADKASDYDRFVITKTMTGNNYLNWDCALMVEHKAYHVSCSLATGGATNYTGLRLYTSNTSKASKYYDFKLSATSFTNLPTSAGANTRRGCENVMLVRDGVNVYLSGY